MTQNIGTNFPVTIPSLTDDASIVDAFRYYHQGSLNGSSAPDSIDQYLADISDATQDIENAVGYVSYNPINNGTASPTLTVNARLTTLEDTVGSSLSSTYVKAIPSSNTDPSARNLIQPSDPAIVPLAIQGVIGQTGNLQEWKTSAATVAKVASTGAVYSYDGTSMSEVATLSGSQTLTNKTIYNAVQTVPVNARTASYTLTLSDQTKIVTVNSTAATTVTIPAEETVNYPIGTMMMIIQLNSGQVTIAPSSGVTLVATPGTKLRTAYSSASIIKIAADYWILSGDTIA